jgi:L-asparagine transporter-like permease
VTPLETDPPPPPDDATARARRPAPPQRARGEHGLVRQLSVGQQAMMAIGGAIGTGLFLGSGLAVNVAGPAVILSYVVAAIISLLLGVALTEMCVANPTAGSFGVYAGQYISPFAGYAVRVSYWLMEVVATGGHLVAASIYMQYFFPHVPGAPWIVLFSAALLYLNTRQVGTFGSFEYWLAMIKVVAIVVFVGLGLVLVAERVGAQHAVPLPGVLSGRAGFFPFGALGIWLGTCFVIYSFIGVEIVGVTSGEAMNPRETIPRAFRRMVLLLSAIYLVTVALLLAIVPWTQLGVGESPFVTVLRRTGVPFAASLMNLVVLSAALSSANANLYLMSRTLFSLARAGFVPASLGAITARGTPVRALLVSSAGLAVAVLVRAAWPESAYVWFFGVALFGALFVWLMIFVTHVAFSMKAPPEARLFPPAAARAASVAGAILMAVLLASTWWAPGLRITLLAGVPWLLVLGFGYAVSVRRR